MSLSEADLRHLRSAFLGNLYLPADTGYEELRRVHNGMIDKHPALIARCQGVADVVSAVGFAREKGLEISIRGGGHNVAGRAVCEDGVMIDLAGMKGMHVNPRNRTAQAQAGLTWKEFNRETQLHGLATTGGVVGTTGIAGLTLGGGIGYLMGKYGLTADNLLTVELVTADGRVIQASSEFHKDLFWGLRGGGGNFGVVTCFEYQLHPVGPEVTGGLIAHPFEASNEVLRFYADFTSDLPDEMVVFGALFHSPDGSGTRLAGMVPCHCGRLRDGEKELGPIKRYGNPVLDMVGAISYEGINGMLDAANPKGALNYWKSGFLAQLTDEVIRIMVEQFSHCPSTMSSIFLENLHGAATRIDPTATAFPHRSEGFNLVIISQWMNPDDSDANIAWARDTYNALEPFMINRVYVNYIGDDESLATVKAAFGPNYDRLQALKDRYDPENIFHLNQNVPPSARTT